MRVQCFLRQLRQAEGKTIRDVETETGISRGQLSLYEQGRQLVRDHHEIQVAEAYGAPSHAWYPPALNILILPDEHRHDQITLARRHAREGST